MRNIEMTMEEEKKKDGKTVWNVSVSIGCSTWMEAEVVMEKVMKGLGKE